MNLDLGVVEKEADRPVGGGTAVFLTQLGADLQRPMETIVGCRLELSDHPYQSKELTQVPLSKEKAQALARELEKMAVNKQLSW